MSMTFYAYREGEGKTIEFSDGPNFSNSNAQMILRSLGYEADDYCFTFDPDELKGRCLTALAVPPIADDGMAPERSGNMINCGVRPGYFADAYRQIADVCDTAKAWDTHVSVA